MPKGTVTLSRRRGGVIVLPVLQAEPAVSSVDVTPSSSNQTLAVVAGSDDEIWELAFDTNVRVRFGENPTVTATSGRLLFGGVPYTYAAKQGQKVAVILAGT
jgi:hypothetical protein